MKSAKIVLSTRSMHPELTRKAQSLFDGCQCITEKRQLTNRTDWEYLFDCIYWTDADVTISIDEDFFLTRPDRLDKIVEYFIENDLQFAGPPATTCDAPIIDNWFHISNNRFLREAMPTRGGKQRVAEILFRTQTTEDSFPGVVFNEHFEPFDRHEFFFLKMIQRGHCKFSVLDSGLSDNREFIAARGKKFGIHTRGGRLYNNPDTKKYIDETYQGVKLTNEKYSNNSR